MATETDHRGTPRAYWDSDERWEQLMASLQAHEDEMRRRHERRVAARAAAGTDEFGRPRPS